MTQTTQATVRRRRTFPQVALNRWTGLSNQLVNTDGFMRDHFRPAYANPHNPLHKRANVLPSLAQDRGGFYSHQPIYLLGAYVMERLFVTVS
jgi:hypothetical protein